MKNWLSDHTSKFRRFGRYGIPLMVTIVIWSAGCSGAVPLTSTETGSIKSTPAVIPTPTAAIPTPTAAMPTPTAAMPTPTAAIPTPTAAIPTPTAAIQPAIVVRITPSKDTTIYSENSKMSNGGGKYIFTGNNNQSDARRALISFDTTNHIAKGSEILTATLTMSMDRAREGDFKVSVHRLTSEWGEGSSQGGQGEGAGGPVKGFDATWRNRISPDKAWEKKGGDYIKEASSSINVGSPSQYAWSGNKLITDIQGWIDKEYPDFGWIIIGDEENSITAKRFSSRTGPSTPILEIEYIAPNSR